MRKFKRVILSIYDLGIEWFILPTIVYGDHWNMKTIGIRWLRWEGYVAFEYAIFDETGEEI